MGSHRPAVSPRASIQTSSRPSEWHVTQRLYPYWKVDQHAYSDAIEVAKQLPKVSKSAGIPEWDLVGPTEVGGRIVDLDYNPRHPDSVYAAAATGGVFLSTDGGRNWIPIFDDQPGLSIGDIAVDPVSPSIVYVGTGEANGGHNNLPGTGLFKSEDGGATWRRSGLEGSVSIGRIAIDPHNPNRLFAAVVGSYFAPGAERGVYRSTDQGRTWTQIFAPGDNIGAIDLAIHPEHTDTLYAAMWERVRTYESISLAGPGSGVYRSYDGGETWSRLDSANGLPQGAGVGRIGLTICEAQPQVLYAGFSDGFEHLGIFRTSDGGDRWVDADPLRQARMATSNFGWYFGQIRVNPHDPDDVYFLDVRLANSKNGGDSWSIVGSRLHVDHHALAFVPERGDRVIVGTDGGIGISEDAGTSWVEVRDLPITQFYEVAVDRANPERLLGGTQDNGTIQRDPANGGWGVVLPGDGFTPLIHPTDSNIIYVQSQNGVLQKSLDGGKSRFRVATPERGIDPSEARNWSTPVVMDPSNPEVLYYGTNRVYRTDDGAGSWQPISPILPRRSLSAPKLGTVTSIAVAPSDPKVLYAGTDDGRVWVAVDPETEWIDVSDGLPERWVTQVAIDPTDPLIAYVTFSGLKWREPESHVYRTADGGSTWSDIGSSLPDAPVNAIAIDPVDPSRLFIGSDIGVFMSENGGESWQSLDEGMPVASVYDLDIHAASRRLFASTHGRSIFGTMLPALQVAVEPAEVPPDGPARLETWPNPFARTLHVRFRSDGPSSSESYVTAEIFDLNGRMIRRLSGGTSGSGEVTLEWDGLTSGGSVAPPGVYLISLPAGSDRRRAARTVIRLRE